MIKMPLVGKLEAMHREIPCGESAAGIFYRSHSTGQNTGHHAPDK